MSVPEGIAAVQDAGVSIWLDDLSRERIASGDLQRLLTERGITGVTTNPAIFGKAITGQTTAYADSIARAAAAGLSADETVHRLTLTDVRDACDLLADIYHDTEKADGFVSLEVDPRLAHDTEATIEAARHLWEEVARPNLMVKIPATSAGLPAISATLAQGINVNVTLIFSLDRYREVLAAHHSGLAAAAAANRDLRSIASVGSFFVSRLDTAIDPMLALDAPERGRFAVSNALEAYGLHLASTTSETWGELAAAGARPQRPLWASTGTKDPDYSPVKYVIELLTPGAVNTMPEATLEALAAWSPTASVSGDDLTLSNLIQSTGVNYAATVAELEAAGVSAFQDAWTNLLDSVAEALSRQR